MRRLCQSELYTDNSVQTVYFSVQTVYFSVQTVYLILQAVLVSVQCRPYCAVLKNVSLINANGQIVIELWPALGDSYTQHCTFHTTLHTTHYTLL